MRTIFRIFKSDVKGLWRNKLALLIALAICVLPSLYAWFNIYSNWDPYSNTGTIPVAVVSVDKGYTKSDGEFVVMGDTVIDNLKENDKIGWQFVKTEDEAVDDDLDIVLFVLFERNFLAEVIHVPVGADADIARAARVLENFLHARPFSRE